MQDETAIKDREKLKEQIEALKAKAKEREDLLAQRKEEHAKMVNGLQEKVKQMENNNYLVRKEIQFEQAANRKLQAKVQDLGSKARKTEMEAKAEISRLKVEVDKLKNDLTMAQNRNLEMSKAEMFVQSKGPSESLGAEMRRMNIDLSSIILNVEQLSPDPKPSNPRSKSHSP